MSGKTPAEILTTLGFTRLDITLAMQEKIDAELASWEAEFAAMKIQVSGLGGEYFGPLPRFVYYGNETYAMDNEGGQWKKDERVNLAILGFENCTPQKNFLASVLGLPI